MSQATPEMLRRLTDAALAAGRYRGVQDCILTITQGGSTEEVATRLEELLDEVGRESHAAILIARVEPDWPTNIVNRLQERST